MRIPNINCRYYSPYGQCLAKDEAGYRAIKGQCVKICSAVECKYQLKHLRPAPPKAQGAII